MIFRAFLELRLSFLEELPPLRWQYWRSEWRVLLSWWETAELNRLWQGSSNQRTVVTSEASFLFSRPQHSPFPLPCDCARSEACVRLALESDDQALSLFVLGIYGSGDLAGDGDFFPDELGNE